VLKPVLFVWSSVASELYFSRWCAAALKVETAKVLAPLRICGLLMLNAGELSRWRFAPSSRFDPLKRHTRWFAPSRRYTPEIRPPPAHRRPIAVLQSAHIDTKGQKQVAVGMATSQIAVRRQLGRIPGYPATEGENLLGMLFPGGRTYKGESPRTYCAAITAKSRRRLI